MSRWKPQRKLLIGSLAAVALMAGSLGGVAGSVSAATIPDGTSFVWGAATTIQNQPSFIDAGTDARGFSPGTFGSEFPRMTKLANGSWIIAYAIYDNNGYTRDTNGGTRLQIKTSSDAGRSWTTTATVSENGRDLDNGQIIQQGDGSLVMAYRSVRWYESYRILTRKSTDGGVTWQALGTIDSVEGAAGTLHNPDRGVYEPYMNLLPNGSIGVLYASEKYAASTPAYSQVISMRTSFNGGANWGAESFPVKDLTNSASRPGMPIWTKMANGSYLLVYELCGSDSCNAWQKTSTDGVTWDTAMGQRIAYQAGAPYVLALSDGRLVATSNTQEISISRDNGATWYLNDTNAWASFNAANNYWPALVQTGPNEIGSVTSIGRTGGGHNIQIKFATFNTLTQPAVMNGGLYTFTAQHSGQNLDVDGGSTANGAKTQQWPANGATAQNFALTQQTDGAFLLTNQAGGKVLDVNANSTADGAVVQQWQITGCTCQHWYLDYVGSGIYKVRAAHSGKLLDVTTGSQAPGTAVQQWPDNGGRAQRWSLTQK